MQDTYSRMLITTSTSHQRPEDSYESHSPRVHMDRRSTKIDTAILRKRLSALATCLCITLALAALLFTGVDAADRMLLKGGALEFVINDVFGIGNEYEASNFSELMMEQSFWGNISNRSDSGGIDGKKYPLPSLNRLHLPLEEGTRPANTIPHNPDSNTDEKKYTLEELYKFDRSLVPSGHLPIMPRDLTREYDGVLKLSNETKYTPNLAAIADSTNTVAAFRSVGSSSNEPLVLILHTHGTEAFSEEGSISYSDSFNAPRSSDISKNVVAVGAAMADVFREAEIPTLHCKIMHDAESYKDSYTRAAETIRQYLSDYPSIKYVFDVHRDSLLQADQTKIRPVTLIDGLPTAQIMFVVGTDYFGANHPNWMQNLTLAVRVQSTLNSSYPGFARSIYLRGAAFNEHYTNGSLLLEVGSCGNTLSEAMRSGRALAKTLSEIIKTGW